MKPWNLAVGAVVALVLALLVFKVIPSCKPSHDGAAIQRDPPSSPFAACIRDALVASKQEDSTRAAQIGDAFEAVHALGLGNSEKTNIVQQTYDKQTQLDIVRGCAETAHVAIPLYPVVSVTDSTGLPLDGVTVSAGEFQRCSTGEHSGGICRLLIATQTAASGVHFQLAKPRYRPAPESVAHTFTSAELQSGSLSLRMLALAHRATITVTVASQPVARIAVTPRGSGTYFSEACELTGTDRASTSCLSADTDGDGKVTFYLGEDSTAGGQANSPFSSAELLFAGFRRVCPLDAMLSTDWASCAPRAAPHTAGTAPNCNEAAVFQTLLTNVTPPPGGKKVRISVILDARGTVTAVVPAEAGQNLVGKRVGSVGPCTYTFDAG